MPYGCQRKLIRQVFYLITICRISIEFILGDCPLNNFTVFQPIKYFVDCKDKCQVVLLWFRKSAYQFFVFELKKSIKLTDQILQKIQIILTTAVVVKSFSTNGRIK